MDNVKLLEVIEPGLIKLGIDVKELDITSILDLVKTRGDNLNTITQEVAYFYQPQTASQDDVTKHLTDLAISLLNAFANALDGLDEWSLEAIKAMVKEFCAVQNIKMPQLGMPLRLKLCGTTQTPSFDAVLYILGKNNVLSRLSKSIS